MRLSRTENRQFQANWARPEGRRPRCRTEAPKRRPPQSVSMTDKNASGAVSPVCGRVVATIVGGGIRSAIGISRSRRSIGPAPVATAIATVTISSVAAGAIGRGATLDTAKTGLAATLETMQSASTLETRRTTRDLSRRCARAGTGRKASDRSDRRTTEGRTADA